VWWISLHNTADLSDRPEDWSGKSGNWGWRIFPTGRAIPIKKTWGYGLGKTVKIYDLSERSFSWILKNIGIYTPISPLISTASLLGTKLLFWAMKEKFNELLDYFPPEILSTIINQNLNNITDLYVQLSYSPNPLRKVEQCNTILASCPYLATDCSFTNIGRRIVQKVSQPKFQ